MNWKILVFLLLINKVGLLNSNIWNLCNKLVELKGWEYINYPHNTVI